MAVTGTGGASPSGGLRSTPNVRVERCILFVDESGQFSPPKPGNPDEHVLLAGVAFKDTALTREAIARVVGRLRRRHGPTIKAKHLRYGERQDVARVIREHAYFGVAGAMVDGTHAAECEAGLTELDRHVSTAGAAGWLGSHAPLAAARARAEIATAVSRGLGLYVVHLQSLFNELARWFWRHGICPDIRVTLDEKLPLTTTELPRFLARIAVATSAGWRGDILMRSLWETAAPTQARVATDDACDGLVLADAVAYAYSHVQRGDDPGGEQAAFIARCSRARD